jgi:hypothetical protein
MGLIFPIFVLAVLASISPVTLVVFILLLATTRARINASAFLIGWGISMTVVFSLSYLLGSYHGLHGEGGDRAVAVVEVILGAGFVALAVWQWRKRGEESGHPVGVPPDLAERLKGLNPPGAALLGVLKQPWSLTAAAALVLVHDQSAFVVAVIAFAIFAVVSTATVGAMYLYYRRQPDEANTRLGELMAWVVNAGPTVIAVASLGIGLVLLFDGLRTLVF